MEYATGKSGKKHLGDQGRFLQMIKGFDEYWLHHLNVLEYIFDPDWPDDTEYEVQFGPCSITHIFVTDQEA